MRYLSKLSKLFPAILLLAMFPAVGCARTPAGGEEAKTEPAAAELAPLPEVDKNAPTVEQKYPHLATAGLIYAQLAQLPEGVLMRSDNAIVTAEEIEAHIAKAPEAMREELRKNVFFMFEELATERLLMAEAAKNVTAPGQTDEQKIQSYFGSLVGSATVSDEEIEKFYQANREMVGGRPLERVKPQLSQYLLQQKQQSIMMEHIRTLGKRTPVLVSHTWVADKAALAKDNVVDKARSAGKPSFVSFGADTCIPCQQMAPIREAVGKKYGDKAGIVYVHVGKEQMLASRYSVQTIPLLLFFDAKGNQVVRHDGTMPQQEVERILSELIAKAAAGE